MDFWVRYFLKILTISEIPLEEAAYKIFRKESILFHFFNKKAAPNAYPFWNGWRTLYTLCFFLWLRTLAGNFKNIKEEHHNGNTKNEPPQTEKMLTKN